MIKKLDSFVLYLETNSHHKYELLKSTLFSMQTSKWKFLMFSGSQG